MDTLDFLRAVLADMGWYCVVGLKKDSDTRIQKFYPTLEAAVEVTTQLQSNGFDAYYALATFKDGSSRKAANAQAMRSLFLDLDCGIGKPYATQTDAINALKVFCKTLGTVRPMLVNSGRGVHVYWPLVEAITTEQWLPLATRLKDLCVQHKLHADPSVTSDTARILRVPGTLNFKDEPPKPVEILSSQPIFTTVEQWQEILGASPPIKGFAPMEMDDATKALLGSFVSRFKTIILRSAKGTGCQQIGYIYTEQEKVEEPLWRAALSVANYCIDRDKAIHLISRKHPDYDAAYTNKKASETKGPYTCASFEKLNPGGCEGCPNKGVIRSPIVLGREIEEATEEDNIVVEKLADVPTAPAQTYVIPKYPAPYLRPKNGGVAKRVRGEDADIDIPIYHNDIYVVRRMVDAEVGESVLVRLHLPKDGVREFTIPLTAIGSKEEFRKHVAAKGVAIVKVDELMYYISDWVNHLQMNTIADVAKRQFGWAYEDGAESDTHIFKYPKSFVVGDKEIFADRIELNPPSKPTGRLFPYFRSRGTLDDWKQTTEFFNRPGFELHQFAIGVGFGSPLMIFTAINAAMVHLWSEGSGLGKTTILHCASSIWGDPMEIMTTENDTINTRMNRAEIYKNIVLPLDEITHSRAEDLSKMLKEYTHGHQRNRLDRSANVERIRGDAWQQLCISTGNRDLIEIISSFKAVSRAEAMRVLGLHVTKADLPDKTVTDELAIRLKQTYGTACIPFIQYVLGDMENVRKLFMATMEKLDKAMGLTAEERFYSAIAACSITGLIIAKRLGLINFKIAPIVDWLIRTMKKTKEEVSDISVGVDTLLNNYLAENYNNILRIKSTDDGRNLKNDMEVLVIPDSTPRVSLVARYEYDVKKLYLMIKPFKDWCSKQHLNFFTIESQLITSKAQMVKEKKRMGKGTRMNLPSIYVLVLDCSGFADEETDFALHAATAYVPTEGATYAT
jgi:hypothetical protein